MVKGVHAQQGVALILVLMLTAVMTIVVTLYQYKNKSILNVAESARAYVDIQAKLESVKEELIYTLATTGLWLSIPSPEVNARYGVPADLNFWGQPFEWLEAEITITDTAALVSVLPFDAGLWRMLLLNVGAENTDQLIATLEDWYDTDDFIRLNGAEHQDYEHPDLPRNDMPQTIDELLLVKGMQPYWSLIRPFLTYNGSSAINFDFSPAGLLPALIGQYRADRIKEQRALKTEQQIDLMLQSSEERNVYLSNRLQVTIKVKNEHVTYRQSLVIAKGRNAKRLSYVAEKIPGFIWLEAN